jgi:nanoRNase/pAp phosphatase (c-di-AMP/oligoRNAs hydrolase)
MLNILTPRKEYRVAKTMVLYHAGCPDGFGAAWAFNQKYGRKAQYMAVSHNEEPPMVTGRDVFIVDFCYPRVIMDELEEEANSIVVIDHHKTGLQNCGDLNYCHFDMEQSGSVLAWKYLFKGRVVPALLRHVQDRDLWSWKLDSTEQILSVVDSYNRNFADWNQLNLDMGEIGSQGWRKMVNSGAEIMRYKKSTIKIMLSNKHRIDILGESIPAINSACFQSELGNILSENEEYAAVYYFDGEKYRFSLRSWDNRMDVSSIASEFGGGGHRKAAGFSINNMGELKTGTGEYSGG